MKDKVMSIGLIGTAIAAVCCFTPALVIVLGVLGLAAWVSWLDFVLLPALAFFTGLTLYAFVTRARRRS